MISIRHHRPFTLTEKKVDREVLAAKPIPTPPVFISEKMEAAIKRVCELHGVSGHEIFSKSRIKYVVNARRDLMKIMFHEMNWSCGRIANYMKLDISSVQYHLGLKSKSKSKYGALKDA